VKCVWECHQVGSNKESVMKLRGKLGSVAAVFALGLGMVAGLAMAGEPKAPESPAAVLKMMAAAGQPGAEHKKLEPLVGDWNMTMKMWMDPSQPPAEIKATVKREWIMGGRFVQESVKGEFEGKPFEGLGLWGYDSAQKKYTTVRACGLCGMVQSDTSDIDATGRKFECTTEGKCPVTGEMVKGRDEVVIESKDRIVANIFKTMDGKEFKAMEIVSVRKK
jgi:hypothetical protein